MINIYNTKEKDVVIEFTCHTELGDKGDGCGRYFEPGKKYKGKLEIVEIKRDTRYEPCTLVWVSFNDSFGSRFSVVGNIYHSDKPYWYDFRKYFNCPMKEKREEKIKEVLD